MVSKKILSAYLGAKEYMGPLKNELDNIIDVHEQLVLSASPPINTFWSINTWNNPEVLTIDSINDGVKKLKRILKNLVKIHTKILLEN